MRTERQARERGFTLIEIMVVIVILGVLAALVVPRVMGRPDEARAVAARQDINTIMQALKLYRLDNAQYPSAEQGLAALVEKPALPPEPKNWKPGGYLERLPQDPWGNPYHYANPGTHGEIDVWSLGAHSDGDAATAAASVIGNWGS
jgi:general secretion pathway protein G